MNPMRTAIVTASYSRDFERCRMLCASMDRHMQGDWVHYLLVASFDVALFRELEGPRRRVIDEREILPFWVQAVTDPFSGGGRKMWLTPFSLPLRGWHVQQLRRLGLARIIEEPAMLALDSDVVLLRPFDPATLWQDGDLRFYRKDNAITASARSNHLAWLAHTDRLFGIGPHRLPAHDYVNTMIAWRTDTSRALLDYVEQRSGRHWVRAITASRAYSECIIYGRFVDEVLGGKGHARNDRPLCHVLWEAGDYPKGPEGLRLFMADLAPDQYAVGIQSFIDHDLGAIDAVVREAA
ncbi:DUF6492 family protein [Rhizobium sp. SG2393]|uniref:DUF6492 family protein n=1 Tax=Rhizobium sp. SG2393 TaxID=3276279 RepID=UPI00366B359A